MSDALNGRVIAIAEGRELDVFAGLLQRRGAQVLRYPLIQILDAPDPAPVLDWVRRFSAEAQDLILLTGEGLRRILGCIERHDCSLRPAFLQRLAQVRKLTRGPKPARALRECGLETDLAAATPTTPGVIEALGAWDLRSRWVGVQLYGTEPNVPLMDFLQRAGAKSHTVAPYVYADASDDPTVQELLGRMRAGEVDAIAFTSKAQVDRLFRADEEIAVLSALRATQVAVVGPVVAQALASHGVDIDTMPERSWFLKPLTAALSELLSGIHPL